MSGGGGREGTKERLVGSDYGRAAAVRPGRERRGPRRHVGATADLEFSAMTWKPSEEVDQSVRDWIARSDSSA
jgi:hypothetical protein